MLPTPCSGTVSARGGHLREESMAALEQHHSRTLSPGEQLPGMPVQLVQARRPSEQREAGACAVGPGSRVVPDLLQPHLPLIHALSAVQCCAKTQPVGKLLSSFSGPRGSRALPRDPTTAPGAPWGPAAAPLVVQLRPALDPAPPAVFRPARLRAAQPVILPQMGGTK